MPFNYKEWYKKNKDRLAQVKKAKYQHDPEYRKAIMEAAARKRASTPKEEPTGYTLTQAAEKLGVTAWTVQRWKAKNYFPSPEAVGARFSLTDHQVQLIALLRGFFEKYPTRSSAVHSAELENIVSTIHHNWSV